jgi:hypothetical protein
MAWIKIDAHLNDKSEVFTMAEILEVTRAEVTGHLVKIWAWFDYMTEDGIINSINGYGIIDAYTMKNFALAMAKVGWLKFNDNWEELGVNTLILPNFNKHNGSTAKVRANNAARQAKFRNKQNNAGALPREEKKREDKKKENINYKEIFSHWNENNQEKAERITDNRRKAISKILKSFTLDDLKAAIAEIGKSDFHQGKNERQWKANLDFILKEKNFLAFYEKTKSQANKPKLTWKEAAA